MSWSLILGSNVHTCLHLSDSVCLIVVIPVEDIIQHYSTNSSIICTMFETKMKSGHFLPICLMQVRIIWKLFRCDFFCPRLPPGGSPAGCLIVSGRRRGKYFDTGDRGAAYSQRRQLGAALTAFVWTPANCGRNDGMSWYEERRPKVQPWQPGMQSSLWRSLRNACSLASFGQSWNAGTEVTFIFLVRQSKGQTAVA